MNTVTQIQMTPEDMAKLMQDAMAEALLKKEGEKNEELFGRVVYYTANQTADLLGITTDTLRKRVAEGLIRKENRTATEKYHRDEILRYKKAWEDAHAPFSQA